MAGITSAEAMRRPSTIDRTKINATTESDIRRFMIEDGYDPDAAVEAGAWGVVRPPRAVRERFGLSQAQFATLISVPVATYRNWEQGRTPLPSGIRALFDILDREPDAARRALEPRVTAA
jgi:putative transcriptional regulator